MTEFQRQVSLPNISKFASALLALSDKTSEPELVVSSDATTYFELSLTLATRIQVLDVDTLDALVCLYPTQLRPVQAAMYKLSLRSLAGSYPSTTSSRLASSAARLQATLHLTGGKTGGSVLWKKTVDGALASAQQAIAVLRSTFGEGMDGHYGDLTFESGMLISNITRRHI